jgi:hypothetical protein
MSRKNQNLWMTALFLGAVLALAHVPAAFAGASADENVDDGEEDGTPATDDQTIADEDEGRQPRVDD